MQFSQPSTARLINRLRILNYIAKYDNQSRADVARNLSLNKVSTSEIVDKLIADDLVIETGTKATALGRPPTTLSLQRNSKAIIAVEIGLRTNSVALVNLGGDLLRFERFPTEKNPTPEVMAASIINYAKRILSRLKDPSIVVGMAVSIDGVVEPATGTVLSLAEWNWTRVPLAVVLKRHLPFPILIENSVRAMIFGERWFGNLESTKNYFYLNWGEHINAASILSGKLLSDNSQFGHIPVASQKVCSCGAIGCLETVSAGWALLEQCSDPNLTLKQLFALSEQDSTVQALLSQACDTMLEALLTAAALLRPHEIVIGGPFAVLPEPYLQNLAQDFLERAPQIISSSTIVRKTTLGDNAGIMGTAALALDEFVFKRSQIEQLSHQTL